VRENFTLHGVREHYRFLIIPDPLPIIPFPGQLFPSPARSRWQGIYTIYNAISAAQAVR
jgi:hypothetical protein